MVLVTLWTTRRDTRLSEFCSAQICRALASLHLWDAAVDDHKVLGLLRKWRSASDPTRDAPQR